MEPKAATRQLGFPGSLGLGPSARGLVRCKGHELAQVNRHAQLAALNTLQLSDPSLPTASKAVRVRLPRARLERQERGRMLGKG